ncbi:MAG: YraN family protein [Luteimonas sp.]
MTNTRQRGAEIENAARVYLLRAGLREVAANANYRFGELDLVMLDEDPLDESRFNESRPNDGVHAKDGRHGRTLVFIEVRYRRGAGFGGGAASIDAGKRRKLVRAAQAFLCAHRIYANAPCRFDVIDASGDPDAPAITWLRDAFRADDS